MNGSDTFTYDISDGNGGTATATVHITITPVNDAPTYTVGANQTIAEQTTVSPKTVAGFATVMSAGPADEGLAQNMTFTASNNANDAVLGPAVGQHQQRQPHLHAGGQPQRCARR